MAQIITDFGIVTAGEIRRIMQEAPGPGWRLSDTDGKYYYPSVQLRGLGADAIPMDHHRRPMHLLIVGSHVK